MALSEYERKMLEELEAQLSDEDPGFADTLKPKPSPKAAARQVSPSRPWPSRRLWRHCRPHPRRLGRDGDRGSPRDCRHVPRNLVHDGRRQVLPRRKSGERRSRAEEAKDSSIQPFPGFHGQAGRGVGEAPPPLRRAQTKARRRRAGLLR